MKRCKFLLGIVVITSFLKLNSQNVVVEMKTELGSIITELYQDKAPLTCQNFIKYVKDNKYDGAHYYRVVRMDNQPDNDVKIEVIQGGLGFDNLDDAYAPIKHETTQDTGLLHKDGILSMARLEPGTASSEFFICVGDQPSLDYGGKRNPDGQGFAAFGKVINGMDIVRKIQNLKDKNQMLLEKVNIISITIKE